jgi:hypothetical protein
MTIRYINKTNKVVSSSKLPLNMVATTIHRLISSNMKIVKVG